MYHDRIRGASGASSPRGPFGWLSGLFGPGAAPPATEAPATIAAPDPFPETDLLAREPTLEELTQLAEQLSGLIGAAQQRLDGAVALVDYSADETAAYRRALAQEAGAIDTTCLPTATVAALIGVTQAMIARTQSCEGRLRATNQELRTLQRDLATAQKSAERDPLTGLPNRRALETALIQAVVSAHVTRSALAVAFCDIDGFKRLNDIHGHALGDRVIRLVGDCLAEEEQAGAFVGRHGGEEFVILFEGVDAIDAAARVDAVRAGLAARVLRSRSDGTPIGKVTFSAGVAGLRDGEAGEDLLHRADRALYRAKDGGRNQVVIDAAG